ncbi:MAG: amidase domain-containing protein [Eubacterium sp.]
MKINPYQRADAVSYAKEWALRRNPDYYNFDGIGGDCTNFASQCLLAGCKIMNYTKDTGWYYNSINDRAPAWSSAEYFRKFLLTNSDIGPFATHIAVNKVEIGDFISLFNGIEYYHTLIVADTSGRIPLVCAHTDDSYMRRLDTYSPTSFDAIHILGVITHS